MKILFNSVNNMLAPHFETELELMLNHKEHGDEIFILTCSGALPMCTSNFEHLKTGCIKCRSRFDGGMKVVGLPKQNIFYIQKHAIPAEVPETFASLNELLNWTWDGIEFGPLIASALMPYVADHNASLEEYHKKIRIKLQVLFRAFYSMDEAIKKIKPDLVYIFNGRFCEDAAAVEACKKNGIKFYVHERGGTIDSYALFENAIPHDFEYNKNRVMALWHEKKPDNKEIDQSRQWFIDRRAGIEQSWVSFTADQKRGLLPKNLSPERINIAIFNSSICEYSTFPEWQNPLYHDELDALIAILEHFKNDELIHFYLRIHPHLKGFRNAQMVSLKAIAAHGYKNLTVIWPEEIVDSYALMQASNKVVVFGSTVGVEACFWGKPVVLVGKALYQDLDCCYIPKSREQVMTMIGDDHLAPKDPAHALPYAFFEQNKGIPFKRFKPFGLFKGAFLGNELKPKYGLKDKLQLKIYDRLERWKNKQA